jgi:hypothetical protein
VDCINVAEDSEQWMAVVSTETRLQISWLAEQLTPHECLSSMELVTLL